MEASINKTFLERHGFDINPTEEMLLDDSAQITLQLIETEVDSIKFSRDRSLLFEKKRVLVTDCKAESMTTDKVYVIESTVPVVPTEKESFVLGVSVITLQIMDKLRNSGLKKVAAESSFRFNKEASTMTFSLGLVKDDTSRET